MSYTIYTATGCTRCKIVKQYMDEAGIAYEEKDIKAEGKSEFQKFYKEFRKSLYRGPDGIEFPILADGDLIRQGLGGALALAMAGPDMQGFFGNGILHGEWVDGVNLSNGDPAGTRQFLDVLRHLKRASFRIEATTDGRNPEVLAAALDENLIDRLIMVIPAPLDVAEKAPGYRGDLSDVRESAALVPRAPDFSYETILKPRIGADGQPVYPTPEEVGAVAELIRTVTGDPKHPYLLQRFDPQEAKDEELRAVEVLPDAALLKYRSKARRHMVATEIKK